MAMNVLLPQWGMGMQEGIVVQWLKGEGDPVAEDEPIVEVESEKVTGTVDSPMDGVLARIVVAPGAVAQIYDVLAVVAAEGEQVSEALDAGVAGAERGAAGQPEVVEASPVSKIATPGSRRSSRQAEPRARRLALQLGVDLEAVVGSGPGGRVTEEDVRAASAR